ncbi:MAG: UDP-N-acetylmuramoyl-L-alanine--D-glutamate ligase [Bryobacterales bacterium]
MTFEGKRVLVVGLGESGRAAARFLTARGALVAATDNQPEEKLGAAAGELRDLGVTLHLGGHSDELFLAQDAIVPSPGVAWDLAPIEAARRSGVEILGELEVAAPLLHGRVIGVTGTNGKTTTTSLIGHILRSAGWKVRVAGNIGTPVLSIVNESADDTWNVLELSSFQLEAMSRFRCEIALLLNITPDHLDRHKTLAAYSQAKARIFLAQTAQDHAVLNADDAGCRDLASQVRSKVCWFSRTRALDKGAWVKDEWIVFNGTPVAPVSLPIRGAHNLENALAAVAASALAGVPLEAIGPALSNFKAVEHRLEYVRTLDGVAYYNDSKATNVDATVKAIEAFDGGLWAILGGSDKGVDYYELREPLKQRAHGVLLIGAAADKIATQLDGWVEIQQAGTIEQAITQARRQARPGDTVLLAPACASFDQFQNYGHRGRVFKELVHALD